MQPDALKGGFADLPVQSATAFRAVMQAMARPGTIHHLTGACRQLRCRSPLVWFCSPCVTRIHRYSLARRLIRRTFEAGFPFIPARPFLRLLRR